MGCLRTGTGFRSSPSESCNAKANVRPCALLRDIGHGARHPTSPQGSRGLGQSNHCQIFRRVLPNPGVFYALKKVPTTGKPQFKQLQKNSLWTASGLVFSPCPSHISGEKFIADCHDDTSKLGSWTWSSFEFPTCGQLHVETRWRSTASLRNANWARQRHLSTSAIQQQLQALIVRYSAETSASKNAICSSTTLS